MVIYRLHNTLSSTGQIWGFHPLDFAHVLCAKKGCTPTGMCIGKHM